MITFLARQDLTLYAATSAGAGDAVMMTCSTAGVYSADAAETWNVYQQLGAIPDAGDPAYTDLGASAQLAADRLIAPIPSIRLGRRR